MDRLSFIGHATILLRLDDTALLTDPALGRWVGLLRRQGPPADRRTLEAADVVAISHLHRDHLDLRTLRRLPRTTPVIVPRGAGAVAAKSGVKRIRELGVREQASIGGLTITAVPAHHDPRRDRCGARAEPLGYLIGSRRRRVYFAGDTGLFGEMSSLGALDLALLPVSGWGPSLGSGHMDPAAAARALTLLRPRVAVPIHWGTFYPPGLGRLRPDRLSQPPLDFARLAGAIAPGVRVRVLRPGSSLDLDREEGEQGP